MSQVLNVMSRADMELEEIRNDLPDLGVWPSTSCHITVPGYIDVLYLLGTIQSTHFVNRSLYQYNHDGSWDVEYGMKPLELSVPAESRNSVKVGKFAALRAAAVAFEKLKLQDTIGFPTFYEERNKSWHKGKICVYWSKEKQEYTVVYNRLMGDRESGLYYWDILTKHLVEDGCCKMPEPVKGPVFFENNPFGKPKCF